MTASSQKILNDYHKDPTDQKKEDVVVAYKNLVVYIAKKMTFHYDDLEDLIQVGTIGLIKAIDRYDPNQNTEFASFASPNIIGEIKHYFRDQKQLLKIPRRLQELHSKIKSYVKEKTQQTGEPPSIQTISRVFKISEDDILECLEANQVTQITSLDAPKYSHQDQPTTLIETISKTDDSLSSLDKELLHQSIDQLPSRDQTIIRYRFFHGLTQSQIAEKLHLSQMQISRILQSSLKKLKSHLEDHI